MILNFFYKNAIGIGVLWWFQIYCAWSASFLFEYTYLIFWNSFWTIAPVIGIGLFDRIVDDHVLMDLPELYRYGREGRWFNIWWFVLYMLDATYQSAIVFFLIVYPYDTTTARTDGYGVGMFEFSTVIAISAVMTANFYNGLNTNVWTGWVFFAVFIGTVLLWIYTAIYSVISPGWFVTQVYGNDYYLFRSAYFWLSMPITMCLAIGPRYIAKAWKFGFAPDDLDIMRWIHKRQPHRNIIQDAHGTGALSALKRPALESAGDMSLDPRRPIDPRSASRTDMATGVRSVHRGFDFATEENGVAMRRMQTNLSERRQSSRNLVPEPRPPRKGSLSHVFSLRHALSKKRLTPPKKQQ